MKRITDIFFDLDNTLWDHRKNAFLTLKDLFETKQVQQKYAISVDEFFTTYDEVNERLWERIRDGEIDKQYLRENRFASTFSRFGVHDKQLCDYFETNFIDEIVAFNELCTGAKELLDYLMQKGYDLHVISNGFAEITHRKIQGAGIASYFKSVTSADEVGVRKPNPAVYDFALAKTSANKENSVMVGDDWVCDALGARDYGMSVLFFDALRHGNTAPGIITITDLLQTKEYL